MKYYVTIIIFVSLQLCQCYRVLVVFPFAAKSHLILGDVMVKKLLDNGHEVTYLTPSPNTVKHEKLQEVDVSGVNVFVPDNWINLETLIENEQELKNLYQVTINFNKMVVELLKNHNVQNFLNDPNQNFDVIVMDWIYSEYLVGLAAVFDCPYIWLATFDPQTATLSLIDEATNPAYVPNAISFNIPPYSFTQRVQELWNQMIHRLFVIKNLYILGHDNKLFEEMYAPFLRKRNRVLPSYEDLRYNASLILGNSHVSYGQAIPLPQNYKAVGGYHIDPHLKELPKELKLLMDNSTDGVIYFSMGSILNGNQLPEKLKESLMDTFKGLKQAVIWKLEADFDDVPKNVHLVKWAPQQSILGHTNCQLFITHGGILSTTEAVHFGVPIVGVPMMGDQFNNINRAVNKGFAKKVTMSHNFAEDLKTAINEVLGNSKYTERAKYLSMLYHDRPMPPGKELVYWVEFVARTRGAIHMRSPALLVSWYQKMYLDLIIVIILGLVLTKIFCNILIRTIYYNKQPNRKKIL